jgi:hypothetical protein
VELHFIADDLDEHAWYVDLVADFVEDVQLFAAAAAAGVVESEPEQG